MGSRSLQTFSSAAISRTDSSYVSNAGKALRNEAKKGINSTSAALMRELDRLGASKKNILLTLATRLTSDPKLSGSPKAKELFQELLQMSDYKRAYENSMDGHQKELIGSLLPKGEDGSARVANRQPTYLELQSAYLVPGQEVSFATNESSSETAFRPRRSLTNQGEMNVFDSWLGPKLDYKMGPGLANSLVTLDFNKEENLVIVSGCTKIPKREFQEKMGELNKDNAVVMNNSSGQPKALAYIGVDNKVKFVEIKDDDGFVIVRREGPQAQSPTGFRTVTINHSGDLTISIKNESGKYETTSLDLKRANGRELAQALRGESQSSRA